MQKLEGKTVWFLFLIVLAAGLAAEPISKMVPHLKDTVTVEALGEHNERAFSSMITIDHIQVDGVSYEVENAIEGKWAWYGGYTWRNSEETTDQLPEGMTKRIVLKIPVGRHRKIVFLGADNRGKAQVTYGSSTGFVDTYMKGVSDTNKMNGEEKKYSIPSSPIGLVLVDTLIHCGVFVLLVGLATAAAVIQLSNVEKSAAWWKKHWVMMAIVCIALASFAFGCNTATQKSLWYDELCQVEYLLGGFQESAMQDAATLPLFTLCGYIWYHIVPYGEEFLLLLPELATALGLVVVGLLGKRFFTARIGLFGVLFTAFSQLIVAQCAHEWRPYSFLFLFSGIALYVFLLHVEKGLEKHRKLWLLQIVTMTLLAYDHWFGFFFCGVLFLYDVVLFLNRKTRLENIVPYIIMGVLFLPWIFFILTFKSDAALVWQPVPTLTNAFYVLRYITGVDLNGTFFLFVLGAVLIVSTVIHAIMKNKGEEVKILAVPLFIVSVLISGIYIYGNELSYKSTFWSVRYFVCLVPCTMLIIGYGADKALELISASTGKSFARTLALALAFITIGTSMTASRSSTIGGAETYRGTADWIYNHGNVYNDSTLVFYPDETVLNGWNEYYLTKQGQRDELNIAHEVTDKKEILQYKYIYYVTLHERTSPELEAILKKNYKQTRKSETYSVSIYKLEDR